MSTADQNFSRPGAVDLSGLAASAGEHTSAPSGGSYVVEVTEATFESTAQQSMRYPVVLAMTSPRDPSGSRVINDLTELVNAAAGRMLLGVVDVDASPRIAQALGVSAVPTVVALIAGQVAPMFQGTRDRADIAALIDQVVQVGAANGLTGRAQPQSQSRADSDDSAQVQADPRFAAAEDALSRGDYELAVAEFDKLLKANPKDIQASAGKAQAGLMARTERVDAGVVRMAESDPADIDAQLAAADFEVVTGQAEAAFGRLLGVIRRTSADDRERVRARMVELFEALDPSSDVVMKARRALAMALF